MSHSSWVPSRHMGPTITFKSIQIIVIGCDSLAHLNWSFIHYYHPKDFVGFTFLGHRGLFIPSLSLSTPALKGYTHHIHIGMASNSWVWVTEGRFSLQSYSQSPIKLGLASTKLDVGYRLLNIKSVGLLI